MVWFFVAYLVGSLTFGVILGYLRLGEDIRTRDLPGGSGAFRRLGPAWGALVALLDMAKGALVAALAPVGAWPWAAGGVVAGHNWPVFFGFRGGGGIAPALGFFLIAAPWAALIGVAVALVMAGVYYFVWRRHRRQPYPIPFGAVFGLAALLEQLQGDPPRFFAALAAAAAIALRGLQLLLRGR